MKTIYKIGIVSIALFGLLSCKKEKDKKTVDATILNTKDITSTGCGYLLILQDSGLVKPEYLPSAFQHDGMKVEVEYRHLGIMDTCDYGSKIYDRANILSIKQIRER
jgi:hypothetical protein